MAGRCYKDLVRSILYSISMHIGITERELREDYKYEEQYFNSVMRNLLFNRFISRVKINVDNRFQYGYYLTKKGREYLKHKKDIERYVPKHEDLELIRKEGPI